MNGRNSKRSKKDKEKNKKKKKIKEDLEMKRLILIIVMLTVIALFAGCSITFTTPCCTPSTTPQVCMSELVVKSVNKWGMVLINGEETGYYVDYDCFPSGTQLYYINGLCYPSVTIDVPCNQWIRVGLKSICGEFSPEQWVFTGVEEVVVVEI